MHYSMSIFLDIWNLNGLRVTVTAKLLLPSRSQAMNKQLLFIPLALQWSRTGSTFHIWHVTGPVRERHATSMNMHISVRKSGTTPYIKYTQHRFVEHAHTMGMGIRIRVLDILRSGSVWGNAYYVLE